MALFRKNKTQTDIPELQEYYASQRKESTVVAWLLAIGSLLLTIALLVGLFFGGRWVYRKITNDDSSKPTTSTTKKDDATKSNGATSNGTNSDNSASITSGNTATVPETNSGIGAAVSGTPTTSPAQGVTPQQSQSTNQSAVAATTTIPNTGSEATIALFVAITLLAYVAHRSYLVRR